MMDDRIGITERGDPCFDFAWIKWVLSGKPAILITKNPIVIHKKLSKLPRKNVIVHCTITGFGGTDYEPNVIDSDAALRGYSDLINLLGKDRVILRIDPIVVTWNRIILAEKILRKAREIADTRVRISFLDLYPHVKSRMRAEGIKIPAYKFHAPSALRKKVWESFGYPEVCGEPDMKITPCITEVDCEVLGVAPINQNIQQRFVCGCLANKHELLTEKFRCKHQCIYCYWKDKID